MAKNGKRNNQRRGKKSANLRYSVPSRNVRSSVGGIDKRDHEAVCSLSNPFCAAARGARIPDDDSTPSIPVTIKDTWHLDSDAGGKLAFQIMPRLNDMRKKALTFTGASVATWDSWLDIQDYTVLETNFSQYRIVSFGVRVYSSLAPTNQSGVVRMVTVNEPLPGSASFDGGLWQEITTAPVSECDQYWISKPKGVDWKKYRDISSTDNDYTSLGAYVFGLPASTSNAITVELTINLEFAVKLDTIGSTIAKPGAPSKPHVLAAASSVHAKHNGHHENKPSFWQRMGNFAKNAILETAANAIPFVGQSVARLIGGKSGRMPAIMDRTIEEVD